MARAICKSAGVGLIVLTASLSAQAARTQSPPAAPSPLPATGCNSADQSRGRQLRDAGRDQEAYDLFRSVYDREHIACAEARMGLALRALGRWRDALTALEDVLTHADDPWVASARATLTNEVQEIREHVGEISVALTSPVDGASVVLDGGAPRPLPLSSPLRADAGTSVIEVSAPGYVRVQRTVAVPGKGRVAETVTLVREIAPANTPTAVSNGTTASVTTTLQTPGAGPVTSDPPQTPNPPSASPPPPSGVSVPGVTMSVIGSVFVVAGGVFFGLAKASFDHYDGDPACRTATAGPETLCMSSRIDAGNFRRVAITGLVAGTTALTVGIVLAVLNKGRPIERPPQSSVTCVPSLDAPGVACVGQF